jgi:itaconyl-CoA hydratase
MPGDSEHRAVETWAGRFLEDFNVGDVYRHTPGRTVLPTDNSWFTLLTQNTAALHFDRHLAAKSEWQKPIVNSTFTLALVTGQSVQDISMNAVANLGWDHVRLSSPVYEGDTIYSQSEVISVRESKSRSNAGIVVVETVGFNQDGVIVISFRRTVMVYRQGHGPSRSEVKPHWDKPSPRPPEALQAVAPSPASPATRTSPSAMSSSHVRNSQMDRQLRPSQGGQEA